MQQKKYSNVKLITGLIIEIALAFLDGDLYESIKVSLKLVENKMSKGGVILVHDYVNSALPGVATAVDEWVKQRNKKIKIYQSMAVIEI